MAKEQLTQSATYDTRRAGLSRLLHTRPERYKGVTFYELSAKDGDPFSNSTQRLASFIGGDWIPNTNNYKMILRRAFVGVSAIHGYHAFIDLKEGRITQEEYDAKKARAEHLVKSNAKARRLQPKMESRFTRSGLTTRTRSASIHIEGDFSGRYLDLARLLAALDPSLVQQEKQEPVQQPTFGEETYSYMGYQSLSGRVEDSDANRLFGEYVQAAKDALQGDRTDPELVHAKATLAAIHRLHTDLVKYKRARRSTVVINAMINSGEKKRK